MQKSRNLLVADDDEGDRRQIQIALRQAAVPWRCTFAGSMREAIATCETSVFDCAILDYQLPDQNGLEGVTALRQRLPYLAIIVSSGRGDESVAAEAMRRGAMDYLPKSQINPQSIMRSISRAVELTELQRRIDRQHEELVEFAQVLVHDFKSPVQSVLRFIEIIGGDIVEGRFDRVPQLCQRVVRSSRRMIELIDALHCHATLGESAPLVPVDMNLVMEDALSNLSLTIRDRHARITCDPLPMVLGDAPQLMQLLQNLIGNGIKYCRAATPTVHVSASSLDRTQPAGASRPALFQIADNGIGIPEAECQRIFDPFKRLHGVGEFEGTGLGLATCRKIVERHGGEICCASKLGEGSTFFFTLESAQPAGSGLEQSSQCKQQPVDWAQAHW